MNQRVTALINQIEKELQGTARPEQTPRPENFTPAERQGVEKLFEFLLAPDGQGDTEGLLAQYIQEVLTDQGVFA